ncbi:MAG TPA: NlpC/P60 family protein [Patescibacteria group bacterium]|nr:NlpC/P60 family protein [Patescibacteria group bacterium]
MNNRTSRYFKPICGFLLLMATLAASLPSAEAFQLSITNHYDKEKSVAVAYHDDNVNKWACKGWYNVPAGETRNYAVPESSSLPYVYVYSAAWKGGDRKDTVSLGVVNNKFKYYEDGDLPAEATNPRTVAFTKMDIQEDAIRLVLEPPAGSAPAESGGLGAKIVHLALQQKGKPYAWGGAAPESGFDCSGLTYYVLGQLGVSIERTADVQYHPQESIGYRNLQPGDLVFFFGNPEPNHVGIYIGNNQFIHAANTKGAGPGATGQVMINQFDQWYKSKFVGGRRL